MARLRGSIDIDKEKCKGCGICVTVCPTEVIAMSPDVNSKGYNYAEAVNMDVCTGCTNCSVVCPDAVISVYRVKV